MNTKTPIHPGSSVNTFLEGLPLPILEHLSVLIDRREQKRLQQLATKLLHNEPALGSTEIFGPRVTSGLTVGPSFLLQDLSDVALVDIPTDLHLQYRMLLLASQGDLVAVGVRRSPSFETYCRETLNLGQVEVLLPRHDGLRKSLATRCRDDEQVMSELVTVARREGHLNINPYLGTGAVWKLAGAIALRSGATIRVGAPPPRLTNRVNDKIWFSQRTTEVLGERAIPPSYCAFGPAALAGRVKAIAKRYSSVGIKVPESSGSLGNLVLDSEKLRKRSLGNLQDHLVSLLQHLGWHDTYPVMVSVWECPVIVSPSVQLWIPRRNKGLPVIEGVFNQIVQEPIGEFVGTMPSELPEPMLHQLGQEAVRLGYLFQELGYFGRCSLDAILVGEDLDKAVLHWVECNGRWGGTSIPMTLANRLVGDWSLRPFVVVQRGGIHQPYGDFAEALDRVRHALFSPREPSGGGVVMLLPGRFEDGIGMDFMVIGQTLAAAKAEAESVTAALNRE